MAPSPLRLPGPLAFLLPLVLLLGLAPGAPAQELPGGGQDPLAGAQDFPPILVEVVLPGLASYPQPAVLQALGLTLGQPVRTPNVRAAFEAFGLFVGTGSFEDVPGGVRLVLPVTELPSDIEPRFIGNDSYSLEKIQEWAGIGDRDFIYVHEADQVVARLVEAYRAQGFHFVEAEWVPGPTPPGSAVADVIFAIREGPKVRCTGVVIRGNETLPDTGFWIWSGGLRKLASIRTKGRGLFRWFGGVFREDELQADLQAMRQAYRDRGFLDVKVELERLDFNDLRKRVKVHVVVDEGPLWTVGSVGLQAFERQPPPPGSPRGTEPSLVEQELVFPEQELLDLLRLVPGVPYEAERLSSDRRNLTEHYGSSGYLAAELFENPRASGGFQFLETDVLQDPETHQVHVTYRLVQGRKRRLREVSIRGNQNTRDAIIRREIEVLPGDVVDQEKLIRAQRRLINTGYFTDPQDPAHPPPRFLLRNVEGEPGLVDVSFEVVQGLVVNATLSGGANSDGGLVGIASVSMENFDISALPSSPWSVFDDVYNKRAFHGAGQTFSLEISPGSEVDQWSVGFRDPDIFGRHFDITGGGFNASGRERRYRSHDETRVRFNPFLSHLFRDGQTSLRFGPVWQRVKTRNLQGGALPRTLTLTPEEQDFLGLNLDLRWSDLDNRLYPRDGTYTRWSTTYYGGPLGQDVELVKSEFFHDRYWPLGSAESDVRPGLYMGFALGVAEPFGDTPFVPYSERFFLGGSTNLRGLRFRRVGPNDGDYSLGGESMLRGTFEYRYPLYSTPLPGTTRRQEMFRGGPFLDFGILDTDAWDLDADELRVTAGISLGLTNPIPLVFNFGWPLRDGEGDDSQVFTFRLSLR